MRSRRTLVPATLAKHQPNPASSRTPYLDCMLQIGLPYLTATLPHSMTLDTLMRYWPTAVAA